MLREFDRPQIGALRNTHGNGIVVRLFDFRLLHDIRLDEFAAAKGLTWDAKRPYLIVRCPTALDRLDAGGRIAPLTPEAAFRAQTFLTWREAEDDYIGDAKTKAGKTRRRWKAGHINSEKDE